MGKLTLLLLILHLLTFSEDLSAVRRELGRLSEEVSRLREKLKKEPTSYELVDELNALGYPIYSLYERYGHLREKGEEYGEIYEKARELYEKYLLVKREIFPHFVIQEARRNGLELCGVELAGKEKRKLVVRLPDPEDDARIKEVLENTQILYADRLGFEVVDFRPCRE
ncbi:MAG: hypothetical protein GXN96_01900 [Aquificae bacterium]|nr:hypothetical protein [Aquificota bacterium]